MVYSIIFSLAVLEMEASVLNMFGNHTTTQVDPPPSLSLLFVEYTTFYFILCVCINFFSVNSLLFYVIKIFVFDQFGTWGEQPGFQHTLNSTDLEQ